MPPSERPVLPSELLARRQLFFQCGEESTTKRDIELLGDGCLLWASDFPHEATRTDMKKLGKEHFARKDLSSAAKKKIIYDNAKRFYALLARIDSASVEQHRPEFQSLPFDDTGRSQLTPGAQPAPRRACAEASGWSGWLGLTA